MDGVVAKPINMDISTSTNIGNGHISAIMSVLLGFGAAFSPENIDNTIRIILAISSLATAIMAIRYYYYATKEKKHALRKHRIHHSHEKQV